MVDEARIGSSTLVARKDDVVFAEIDDEVVMMSGDLEAYCGINEVGSRIWQLMERPITVSDLCDRLAEEFEVERDVCEREVASFIERLMSEGVVEAVDEPAA